MWERLKSRTDTIDVGGVVVVRIAVTVHIAEVRRVVHSRQPPVEPVTAEIVYNPYILLLLHTFLV